MALPPRFAAYYSSMTARPAINDMHTAFVINPAVVTVDDAFRAFFTTTPGWLQFTMKWRNKLVGRLDFSTGNDADAPRLPEIIEPGAAVGVFQVVERSDTEILMGADDEHFSVRIAIELVNEPGQSDRFVRIATVAHHHDALGRIYLGIVKYPHGPLAKMCTKLVAGQR